jgi:hypothetical protein
MSQFTRYTGLYKGVVIDTDDPAGLNRVKVRVLEIHGMMNRETYGSLNLGTATEVMWVDEDHLPWAEVCYPYGETTPPEINQVVWVAFYGGDAQYPVIFGWAGYEYTAQEEEFI